MLLIIHYSRKVFLLKAYIDSVLDVVGAAQEPDGYLYTARTINPKHPHGWSGNKRWVKNQKLTLIPYYAWNHRGANQMNVWFYQNLNVLDK